MGNKTAKIFAVPEEENVALSKIAGGPCLHGGLEALGGVVREVHFLKRVPYSSPTDSIQYSSAECVPSIEGSELLLLHIFGASNVIQLT